jgi:hypothetical protein
MSLLRFFNFISIDEAKEMAFWILQNKNLFKDANMNGRRITTRYSDHNSFNYPLVIKQVRERIVKMLGVEEEENFRIIPPFKEGVVASCAFPGDTCYEHLDPAWHFGFNTLHCNVIVQAPDKGGDLILNGEVEPMRERELCCYLVSKDLHETTLVEGSKERLMWIFGFCIDDEKWKMLSEKH